MKREPSHQEIERLLEEIEEYLAAVSAFREEGAEPSWTAEDTGPEWWLAEHLPARSEQKPAEVGA